MLLDTDVVVKTSTLIPTMLAAPQTNLKTQGVQDPTMAKAMKHSGGDSVKVIRSLEEVEAIRDIWNSWQWNPNADIEFYLHVLRTNAKVIRPHVVVLYRDGLPVAMLVGRLMMESIHTRVGYALWFGGRTQILTFIYAGQAGDLSEQNSRALVADVVRALRNGEANRATFRFIATESHFFRALTQYPGFFTRDHFPQKQIHLKMDLPQSAEEIYSRLSSKVRKNLKWQGKKLIEAFDGKVRIECFRRPGELERMFEDVEQVAEKSYHRGLGFGFVDNQEMRERVQLESQKGWFRAYVLYLADHPAAFWIGNVSGRTFHSGFLGYDNVHGRYSPGIFLITKAFEKLCNEGVAEIDFGLGDAEYKRRFGSSSWEEACVDIFAPRLKGLMINALRSPALLTEVLIKRSLNNTQIMARIKKLWRNRAIRSVQKGSTAA